MGISGIEASTTWKNYVNQKRGQIGKQENSTSALFAQLNQKVEELSEKIRNGQSEPSFQIGGQSYTKEEWEKLLSKIDSISANDTDTSSTAKGSGLTEIMTGKKAPYSYLAKDGIIDYNGVVFVCDYEHNALCLGDTGNTKDCITVPLENGGTLIVNRDNIGSLASAIDMFSPEDINRIMRAIAKDAKVQQMQHEIDEETNSIGNAETEATGKVETKEEEILRRLCDA